MSKFFDDLKKKQDHMWHSHVQPKVHSLIARCAAENRRISLDDWRELFVEVGLNSWDREVLMPLLSDAVLVEQAQNCLKNCSRIPKYHTSGPCSTYDEIMQHVIVPLLIKRLHEHIPQGVPT